MDDTITASEYVARETLEEVEDAVARTRGCTFGCVMTDAAWSGARRVAGIMQPIFSCRTCALAGGTSVGVCEPCALRCHSDHELVEVGTRRTFRCDCPTERCPAPCVSGGAGGSAKAPASATNRYGQNFEGRFCSCARPHDAERDVMLQCISCDEWYHDLHIPGHPGFDTEGMVCAACVRTRPYLRVLAHYSAGVCEAKAAAGASSSTPAAASLETSTLEEPVVAGVSTSGGAEAVAAESAPAPPAVPASPGQQGGQPVPAPAAVTPGASPDSSFASEPSGARLQPWVACLTCSEGADEGAGVCVACAELCHAGHVLSKPRITLFTCDCTELLQAKQRGECRCAPPATAASSAPRGEQWCAGRSEAVVGGSSSSSSPAPYAAAAAAPAEATPAHFIAALPSAEAPAQAGSAAVATPRFADGAAVFLFADDDLLSALCRCDACMDRYAADGVATWWLTPEDAPVDPTAPLAAGVGVPALRRVPGLIAEVLGGLHAASGAPVTAGTASAAAPGAPPVEAAAGELAAAIGGLRASGFRTSYEAGLDALQALPPTQQVAALSSYGELAGDLMPFLRTFAEAGRVVTADDIRQFFANLADGRRVRSRLA